MAFGKKKSASEKNESNSILKRSIAIKGNIVMSDPLYVDCHIKGTVTSNSDTAHLTVGPSGEIVGDVYGFHVDIYGSIEGNIDCVSIKIHAKARIKGNISYQVIDMEPDSHVEGEVHNRERDKVQKAMSANNAIKGNKANTVSTANVKKL